MAGDPYAPHLERARALFAGGEVLQAGQIWQAILKKQPDHAEARTGLLQVKRWMESRRAPEPAASAAAPPAAPEPAAPEPAAPEPIAPEPIEPEPMVAAALPEPAPYVAGRAFKSTLPYKPIKAEDPGPEPTAAEEEAIPAVEPEVRPGGFDSDELEPVERLLKEGCTLFDMGQTEDALLKWEQILAQDPGHALARAYIAQAHQELGYEPAEMAVAAPPPAPPPVAAPAPQVEPEELLRRASQLYEMGSLEESITTLERILELDPGHADAQRFLLLAKRELAESTPPSHSLPSWPAPAAVAPPPPDYAAATIYRTPPPPEPTPRLAEPSVQARTSGFISPPGRTGSDTLEQKLSQGERLLLLGRYEEAGFAFQMALSVAPDDPRALEGLERAKGQAPPKSLPETTLPGVPAGFVPPAPPPVAPPPAAPAPVLPPASVTAPAASRQGPELPRSLQDLSQHPVLGSTKFLVGGAVLVVVLGVGLQVLQKQRKDAQLRTAVSSARDSAVAPVSLTARTIDLAESVAAVRQEADTVLAFDPVRSYHRAKELLRRDPADAVGAALMEKAKAALLADPVPGVSLTEFQRLLGAGDLESAERAIDALLRARPEEPDLMLRAARLERVLAGLHASKGEWAEARTALQKGRALFPEDKSWQARIQLLERIQSMPKAEQAGWLAFLG